MQPNITTAMTDEVQIDSGLVFKNYGVEGEQKELGIIADGLTFKIESEYRDIPIEGALGPVKGNRRLIKRMASAAFNLRNVSIETLKMALPGTTATTTKITGDFTDGIIPDTDYLDNITIVGKKANGKYVKVMVKNTLHDGGLELAFKQADEATVAFNMMSFYDPTDLSAEPWEIEELTAIA